MHMRTAQRNNNLDKSYRYNCITAHGGNARGTRIRCFSLVWPSTGTGRWCSPRGSGGSAAWGTSGMSKFAMLRRPAPEPPAAGRTFSARRPVSERGSDSGFGWTDRGEVGWTLVGQNGICCGQGFAKMRSGWPAGWWNGARKVWDFPHLWGFLTFTKVLPCYTSIWSEKKACVTWKRLIFQWNKDSRNILLQQPCCALTSPPPWAPELPQHTLPLPENNAAQSWTQPAICWGELFIFSHSQLWGLGYDTAILGTFGSPWQIFPFAWAARAPTLSMPWKS